MTVDELAGMLTRNEPVTVVDNNGRARYEQGHIPGARFVGHDEVTAAALLPPTATPAPRVLLLQRALNGVPHGRAAGCRARVS
jgi:3-mercaptopyruvate sulfurtransferase SseA